VDEAGNHSADHRCGEGFHDFGALAMAPHDRKETRDDGGDGHDFGTEPKARAVFYGLNEIIVVEGASLLGHALFDHLFEVNNHDNTSLNSGAE